MPSQRGLIVLAAGAALLAGSRLLGIRELYEIGIGLELLALAGFLLVRRRKQNFLASRKVIPARAYAGSTVKVEITIENESPQLSEPLAYADDLPEQLGSGYRFGLNPIEAGGSRILEYDVHPPSRGKFTIGPGKLWFTDPFGMARSSISPAKPSELIVYPEIETLATSGSRFDRFGGGLNRSLAADLSGDEFFTMREYQWGDDLRKIHWASTARTGKLMIRQEELQRQTSATVIVDDRHLGDRTASDAFEASLRSAGSLINHFIHRGLVTALFFGSERPAVGPSSYSSTQDHYHRCMERLAIASSSGDSDLPWLLMALKRARVAEGSTSIVTNSLKATAEALIGVGFSATAECLVIFHPQQAFSERAEAASLEEARLFHLLSTRGIKVLTVPGRTRLATVWNRRITSLPVAQ